MGKDILIIGIGHDFRSDDSIGLKTARKIADLGLDQIDVTEASGEGTQLLNLWENYSTVYIIDAAISGNTVGDIYRFVPSDLEKFRHWFSCTSHTFSLPQAIELGETLGKLPANLIIFGIESANFDFGTEPNEVLDRSSDIVVELIRKEISQVKKEPSVK